MTGNGLASSGLYDAVAFYSTGLAARHSHDAQIACFLTGGNARRHQMISNIDTTRYFDDVTKTLAPDAENFIVAANPVQPYSEGEIVLDSADPAALPFRKPARRAATSGDPAHTLKGR